MLFLNCSSGEDELAEQQVNFFAALYSHKITLQANLDLGGLKASFLELYSASEKYYKF